MTFHYNFLSIILEEMCKCDFTNNLICHYPNSRCPLQDAGFIIFVDEILRDPEDGFGGGQGGQNLQKIFFSPELKERKFLLRCNVLALFDDLKWKDKIIPAYEVIEYVRAKLPEFAQKGIVTKKFCRIMFRAYKIYRKYKCPDQRFRYFI